MEKQCLEIEQKVVESQEHGRCLGAPTPISAAISFYSILSSGTDIHRSSRTISSQALLSYLSCDCWTIVEYVDIHSKWFYNGVAVSPYAAASQGGGARWMYR